MQLTGPEILRRMTAKGKPDIIIEPFDLRCLGSNSYDLHLADTLRVYRHTLPNGMKPAIEYKGAPLLHSMRDWFHDEYDYLLVAERYNIPNLMRQINEDPEHKVYRLLDFSARPRDIADPWYTGDFDVTYDDIMEGLEAFLEHLKKEGKL